ncbi:MAG: ATP-grasp domain-containing protein [Planctomycetota bacterium]
MSSVSPKAAPRESAASRARVIVPTLCVGILASADSALAHGEPRDRIAVAAAAVEVGAVESACRARGWRTTHIPASPDPRRTRAALEREKPDVVFHLAESVGGDSRVESLLAALLEGLGLPYTGSGSKALWAGLHKPIARKKLAAAGVAVPEGFVLETARSPVPRAFRRLAKARWIVKPSREDASHGIAIESVVSGEKAVRERAAFVIRTYAQPALVEEFIEGREFNVSILEGANGPRVLPLAEIDFEKFPKGAPRLVTFASKWMKASAEFRGTPSIAARRTAPGTARAIREAAKAAWKALGLRDYGRVDIRIGEDGEPRVLDVNPNPDVSPGSGLSKAAERDGLTHEELIAGIVESALRRARSRAASAAAI